MQDSNRKGLILDSSGRTYGEGGLGVVLRPWQDINRKHVLNKSDTTAARALALVRMQEEVEADAKKQVSEDVERVLGTMSRTEFRLRKADARRKLKKAAKMMRRRA